MFSIGLLRWRAEDVVPIVTCSIVVFSHWVISLSSHQAAGISGVSVIWGLDYWMTHIFAFCGSVQLFLCYWVPSKFEDWVHALTVCLLVGMARPGQHQTHRCSLPCQFPTVRRRGVTSQRGTKVNYPVEELEPRSLALQWHVSAHQKL